LREFGKFYIMLISLLCSGCVSTESFLKPESPEWFSYARPETISAYYANRCATYGFRSGTGGMAECIRREAAAARSKNAVFGAITEVRKIASGHNADDDWDF